MFLRIYRKSPSDDPRNTNDFPQLGSLATTVFIADPEMKNLQILVTEFRSNIILFIYL